VLGEERFREAGGPDTVSLVAPIGHLLAAQHRSCSDAVTLGPARHREASPANRNSRRRRTQVRFDLFDVGMRRDLLNLFPCQHCRKTID
jgi:hypothetical protein